MPNPGLPNARPRQAEQNPDGTWNIRDVPVFAELPAGARGNPNDVGREWMLRAIDKAKARFSEHYVPPVHINHHKANGETKRAGYFQLTAVRPTLHDGKPVWTIFADLLSVPPDVFAQIERGELPYRSVEIHDWQNPEINSLALLDDEVPFFRFEILSVARKEAAHTMAAMGAPAVAMCSTSSEARCLFRFEEDTMPMPTDEMTPVDALPPEQAEKPEGEMSFEDRVMDRLSKLEAAIGGLMADDEEEQPSPDDSAVPEADVPDSAPVEEPAAEEAPSEKEESFAGSKRWRILDASGNEVTVVTANSSDEALEKAADAGHVGSDAEPAGGQMRAKDHTEVAQLSARVAAMEARERQRSAQDRIATLVAKAQEDLAGWPMPSLEALKKMAAKGPDAIEVFVAEYKRGAPKDPPRTTEDLDAGGARLVAAHPDCFAQFAARGPEVLEKAQRAAAEHAELRAHNPTFSVPLESYVARAVDGVELGR